jgi:hypothetical protein
VQGPDFWPTPSTYILGCMLEQCFLSLSAYTTCFALKKYKHDLTKHFRLFICDLRDNTVGVSGCTCRIECYTDERITICRVLSTRFDDYVSSLNLCGLTRWVHPTVLSEWGNDLCEAPI